MEIQKRFEGIDLIKLCVLLILLFIPLILYLNAGSQAQAERTGQIDLTTQGELPPGSETTGEEAQEKSAEEALAPGEAGQDGTGSFGDRIQIEGEQTGEAASSESSTDETSLAAPEMPAFPPPPPSGETLFLDEEGGKLYTPTGQVVYELDETGEVWVPVVPTEVAEAAGATEPEMGENGFWVLMNEMGEIAFIWEPGRLVWRSFDGTLIISIPPTEGYQTGTEPSGEEGEASSGSEGETAGGTTGETETGAAEGSAETGAGGTETGSTGTGAAEEENATTSSEEVPQVTIPPELLVVPKVYTIRTGEFIYCLGRRFNINPYDLLRANGLYRNWIVPAGMKLTIPQYGDTFPAERALLEHPVMHTVQAGETIYSIACQYGDVFPEAIVYANGLSAPYSLQPGTQIIIP
jgi:LysM repeat protein